MTSPWTELRRMVLSLPKAMKHLAVVVLCLLLVIYEVSLAPVPCRQRRDVKDKEHKKKATKKQYVPMYPSYDSTTYPSSDAATMYPSSDTASVICEDNRPVELVQIRDLSIVNGVIKKSDIVQG